MSHETGGVWEAVRKGIAKVIVEHHHYLETKRKLLRALKTDNLVLLVGAAGVGKTTLVRRLVDELNEVVRDDPCSVRAILFRAPSSHGTRYAWKAFYQRWADVMYEPLFDRQVNRERIAACWSSDRSPSAFRPGTADDMRLRVFKATRDRGVEVAFVDEAANLVLNEAGRTLRDRLDVLRDLCDESSEEEGNLDEGSFSIVLFSTFRIVQGDALKLSPELIRRMKRTEFSRYDPEAANGSAEFLAYRDVVKAFLDEVPEELRPTLNVDCLRKLLKGSVGCVGILCKWLLRAIALCEEEGAEKLEWRHFEETSLSKGDVERLDEQCVLGEEAWMKLDEEIDGGSMSSECAGTTSARRSRGKSGRRIGLPAAGRRPTGRDGA